MECLNVKYENKPCYNIHFRPDFTDFATVFKSDLNKQYDNICIVSDSNVANLYLAELVEICKTLSDNVCSFSFEAGEASKNLNTVSLLYEHLIMKKFTRSSLLIALGGGVVGDLTGFAAATFLRGIDFIQVPTTLLSQVDSSVGGKTGVDFNQYKNMVGAFKMPKMVYMNIGTLNTLDDDNFACGMGEVIKHGLIADKDFYQWLKDNKDKIEAKDYDALAYMVKKNCDIKRHVVEIDPTEKGIRAYLNFGHTLGHAIEKLCNFSLGHGQCVGIGMVCASYLSMKLGHITEDEHKDIINSLKLYNIPVNVSGLAASDILAASKSDKKMTGTKIKFTILKAIGEAASCLDFTDEDLLEAIDQVLV
ncbi:3-dehydroquinate synthase [Pseudobutyrivibrio xylanivorans]|uniref:3-dehydroquinate synthase n=1 Tax=Pseudobutyrivibrio xylanivorans DSM 14809 TaxID=1123012 RepID=A0A1M6I6L7_PSEXY|nr:3-dehydroquinate synthase [Pseudobutyrivibrio xylanivorans]SHJ30044.1 3-dehydroquinate synthase [Pseudobutyrivibrio xylanivorans DSM 14809]